jgi:photosystem I reaction center subunit XII
MEISLRCQISIDSIVFIVLVFTTKTCFLFLQLKESYFMTLSDNEIFIALFAALLTGILAVRLGIELARPMSS